MPQSLTILEQDDGKVSITWTGQVTHAYGLAEMAKKLLEARMKADPVTEVKPEVPIQNV